MGIVSNFDAGDPEARLPPRIVHEDSAPVSAFVPAPAAAEPTRFTIGDRVSFPSMPRGTITAISGVNTVSRVRAVDRTGVVYSVPPTEASRVEDPSEFYKIEQSELSKAQAGVLYVELTETLGTSAELRFSYEEAFKELVCDVISPKRFLDSCETDCFVADADPCVRWIR